MKKNIIERKDMEKEICKAQKQFNKVVKKIDKLGKQQRKGNCIIMPEKLRYEYLEIAFKYIQIEELYNKYFDNEEDD